MYVSRWVEVKVLESHYVCRECRSIPWRTRLLDVKFTNCIIRGYESNVSSLPFCPIEVNFEVNLSHCTVYSDVHGTRRLTVSFLNVELSPWSD